MRICSPHCGVAPETTSGGRDLRARAARAARAGPACASSSSWPAASRTRRACPNWTVHRFAIGRGLRWYVAPFVVPAAIRRVVRRGRLRPAARALAPLHRAGRALGAAPSTASTCPWSPITITSTRARSTALIEKRVVDASDRVVVGSEFARRQLREELGARTDHVAVVPYGVDPRFAPRPPRADASRALRPRRAARSCCSSAGSSRARTSALLLDVWAARGARRIRTRACWSPAAGRCSPSSAPRRAARAGRPRRLHRLRARGREGRRTSTSRTSSSSRRRWRASASRSAEAMSSGLPVVASNRGSIPELVVDGEGGFVCDPAGPGALRRAAARCSWATRRSGEKLGAANRERVDRLLPLGALRGRHAPRLRGHARGLAPARRRDRGR